MPILDDKKLLAQWDNHKNISDGELASQHAEARNDHAFHAGNKMAYTSSVMDKGRKISVTFNKVKPYIDAVTGFMVQLRRKPDYQARITEDRMQQEFSEYCNGLSDYIRSNANMDSLETRQDRELLITGYGAIDTNVIYETNPDGEVKAENIEYDDIYWDPQAREPNLLDARWVYRRKKFNRKEAIRRFKGVKPEDFEEYKPEQTNYVYNPYDGEYTKVALGFGDTPEDLIEVFYYQWWELQTYYRAKNPLASMDNEFIREDLGMLMAFMRNKRKEEAQEEYYEDYFEFDPFAEYLIMTPEIKTDMDAAFRRYGIDVEYQVLQKRCYYTALITGKKVLKKFKSPDQQGFTIKFKTGEYDYINNRWFGMVAALKEPARYANKSLTEILYVIAANSKGGVMYEESAVEDPAKFEQQWASTKAAIKVQDGALSGAKIAPKAQSALPNGYENVYNISNESLGEVTGINKEFLGNSTNTQVSALLETQRINQVVSTLACYFDAIGLYQKEHARLMLTYMRQLAENSSGRLIKILGKNGAARFIELSSDRLAEEYDVEIAEAPISAVQKQQTTEIMLGLADKLALLGTNIYPVVVDYLPIKQTDKQKLLEILTPKPPTMQEIQEQQAIKRIALEGDMARVAKDQADSIYKQAQAAKTAKETLKTQVDMDKIRADTLRTMAEGEQKMLENDVIKRMPVDQLNLVI